jgi:hypothetical protein
MRYPASEKLEIIQLFEQSHLLVSRTAWHPEGHLLLYGRLSRCKSNLI